ncbi:extracellular solute-binding protein [Photobacterium sp.]|uniref:extracellular solute-binding protein n=1 Tax=Photobacterium sp. TaxID=660 RepID=UPI00299D879A|nr:extracellular solute-binding protein [Photobacterium sp.]MDX1304069.1 extracellular solute-binding protein [Photobacterium sp.]
MYEKIKLSALAMISALGFTVHAATLPDDLEWISNPNEPIFASSDAQFGGTFRTYLQSFPQTFRIVGPDSNGSFRHWLLDTRPNLVRRHPITYKWIPELANEWAYGKDNKSIYFRINPNAQWSDGKPITAEDFKFAVQLMRSKDIVAPWYNNYFTEQVEGVGEIDDHTIVITSTKAKNREDLMTTLYDIQPRPAHFYTPRVDKNSDGVDDNFVRLYNFKAEPSSGPYYVDKVKKGKSISFKHVGRDWWGYSNKYYKNRYNVEKIRIKVIRDQDIAQKYFEKGDLDAFGLIMPSLWHEKSNGEPYQNGYINRFWGYNQLPQGSGGVWINTAKPHLDDINVRKGLALAIDFDGMIEKVLRGDYVRKPNGLGVGHGEYTNTDIKPDPFDPNRAADYFIRAGFDQVGPDGIRVNSRGEKLMFAVTYSYSAHTPRIAYLKEQAKQAGLELTLNLVDGSSAFKYVLEKKHELSFHNMGTSYIPQYWEYFHSDNATKPQTNNFTNYSSPELDKLIMAYRAEFDLGRKRAISRQIQQTVADASVIIPGYIVPYTREGYWRWLKYPTPAMTKLTEAMFSPIDLSTFWIDEEIKKETLSAMKKGKHFEPVTVIDDTYKL